MSSFSAQAAATLMLLGEHAVLHGYHAIVCAVNRYITVELSPRNDELIHIDSELGQLQSSIRIINRQAPFEFVTEAIYSFKERLNTGFDLKIKSNFSHQAGLGSSAAVSVATVSVLDQWINNTSIPSEASKLMEIFLKSREIIQKVQGLGSGADVAASVFGGTISYCMNPLSIKKLSTKPPITVVYSGSKKPTREVVSWLEQQRQHDPEAINLIFKQMHQSCLEAVDCIESENWPALGEILHINQAYMKSLGLSNPLLDELTHKLESFPELFGAKISGSGLGDCVLAIGHLSSTCFPMNPIQRELGVRQFNLEIS